MLMKITCPACSFTREVDEGKLPPAAAIATCPRCKERFRFREPEDLSHPHDEVRAPSTPPEAEPDPRRQAAEAYRRAAELPPLPDEELTNPWENPHDGYPAAFYQTAVRVLFAAPRFFAGLAPQKPLARALAFYLIVGLVQIGAEQFWLAAFAKILAPRAESDPQFAQLLTLLSREMSLPLFVLARTAFITFELFVASVLYHVMFRLVAPGRTDFSLVFQVIAYASAPGLLGIIPLLGSLVGFVWSIACSVVGCRYALRISWTQTLMALGPLYLLFALLFVQASIVAQGL